MFSVVQNIVLSVWKLLAYACEIKILESLVCLLLTLNVENALPLDVLLRKML